MKGMLPIFIPFTDHEWLPFHNCSGCQARNCCYKRAYAGLHGQRIDGNILRRACHYECGILKRQKGMVEIAVIFHKITIRMPIYIRRTAKQIAGNYRYLTPRERR